VHPADRPRRCARELPDVSPATSFFPMPRSSVGRNGLAAELQADGPSDWTRCWLILFQGRDLYQFLLCSRSIPVRKELLLV